MEPLQPDYRGPAITGLASALVARDAVPWMPEAVEGARAVVLMLLDGLGWNTIEAHRSRLPVLSGLSGQAISTVVPSTTASALTSIATGLAPSQHGVVGFRMRYDHGVLNVLRWQYADGRRPPDPLRVQRTAAFLGRDVPVITKREFRATGFTEAHLRGTRFVGWNTTAILVEHVRREVAAGAPFVYAYYPGVDTVAHEYGLHDEFFLAELGATDRLVGDVLAALPGDVALVVTSDHGQVHVGRDGWIGLDAIASLVEACAGDGRFRYLHAHEGAAGELLVAAEAEYGGHAWVFSREQLLDEGWLGPGPVIGGVQRRIGDVILAAREPVAFIDPELERERNLIGAHGSLTPDEMLVPLLAGRGTG